MIETYGRYFVSLASMLASFDTIACHGFVQQPDGKLRVSDIKLTESFLASLKAFIPDMKALNLDLSHMFALRLVETWENPGKGFERVHGTGMIDILSVRIRDELATRFFMYVPADKAVLYNNPVKGWEEVISRFPQTGGDIEEVSKCLALSRYPGAVFHSVSVIEHGLIALGGFIGVADPKSGWTAVTGALERIVSKTKFTELDPKFQTCFGFLEQVYGTAIALKGSWRNKISHAQGRLAVLTPEFAPEIAEEIITASRSFMRRLATEMP